jgi:hypothetical protein
MGSRIACDLERSAGCPARRMVVQTAGQLTVRLYRNPTRAEVLATGLGTLMAAGGRDCRIKGRCPGGRTAGDAGNGMTLDLAGGWTPGGTDGKWGVGSGGLREGAKRNTRVRWRNDLNVSTRNCITGFGPTMFVRSIARHFLHRQIGRTASVAMARFCVRQSCDGKPGGWTALID